MCVPMTIDYIIRAGAWRSWGMTAEDDRERETSTLAVDVFGGNDIPVDNGHA